MACETLVKSNQVVIAGEITTAAKINYELVVREAVRDIGYVNDDDVFHCDKVFIHNLLTRQSPDIAQGVDARKAEGKETAEQGAGDQGLMFGYACNETPEMMPTAIMYAHRLGRELTKLRKAGVVGWLRPDAKSQVSIRYEDDRPVKVENVVISTQHTPNVKHADIRDFLIEYVIRKVIPAEHDGRLDPVPDQPHRPVRGRAAPRATPASPGGRSSSTPTAAGAATAAARFPARTPPRSTVRRRTCAAGSRRTSSPPASPTSASCRSPTRSATPSP